VADRYVIAKDDVLDVMVEGVGELSREYRVGMDGMITLPMLTRPVMAAGLTIEQLSKAIAKELVDAGLLTDPQVIISMKSSPWNTVVLSGAAKKPGLYPVYGHMTMLELLTLAEGLTDDAGNTATVTRGQNAPDGPELTTSQAVDDANGTSPRTVKVQVWKLWHDGDATLDVDLYPGDRVLVKRAGIVYIVGAVSRPGGYVLNDEEPMTLLTAIAVSLGFLPTAKTSKTMLIRKNPSVPGGREQFQVDLKKVLTLHAPDQQLFANDILYVPDSSGKRTINNLSTGLLNTAVYAGVWRVAY
jgi:polysaccharide export outer membrane protein